MEGLSSVPGAGDYAIITAGSNKVEGHMKIEEKANIGFGLF